MTVSASDVVIENAGFSNATIAIALPDTFTPSYGGCYDIVVNMALPDYTTGASMTIGGVYVHDSKGFYKRIRRLSAPFVVRARYFGDPERYQIISLRPLRWTACA